MLWKIALKNIKNQKLAYSMVFMLLTVITVTVLVLVAAMNVKLKKYSSISKYLKQDGLLIASDYIQTRYDDKPILCRDAEEMKSQNPEVKDVLSVAEIVGGYLSNPEKELTVWCYNQNVIDMLNPTMSEGRWFEEEDRNSDTVKAVVTYNEGQLSVGDVVTLATIMNDTVTEQVEIIGVMNNDETLFYNSGNHQDYRDCFYTYDYEAEEGRIIMILSDGQLLNGEEEGKFSNLNFRVDNVHGFQKQMEGETLILFNDDVTEEDIVRFEERIKPISWIYSIVPLEKINKNSKKYIYEDLKKYFPIIGCFFVFVLISVSSAHLVSTKKKLHDYAIYYMCGLTWKQCCIISLYVSVIMSCISIGLIGTMYAILAAFGIISLKLDSTLLVYIAAAFIINLLFVTISWITPFMATKNSSATKIMKTL